MDFKRITLLAGHYGSGKTNIAVNLAMQLRRVADNVAIAEAAILAGCRHYFGYPITPQTEIAAYMAKRMPKVGGTFLQAESEIGAINMVYGCASTGKRAMTSSSSPGISLKGEGISYMDGPAYLERVAVNNVKNVKAAGKAIKKAFQNQIDGKGFSLIEVLSSCPTNWGMTPQKALEWIDEKMIPCYPLGVYKDRTAEEEQA